MGLFSKIAGDSDARREHQEAKDNLTRIGKRDRHETNDFVEANECVVQAEQNLPRWRQK